MGGEFPEEIDLEGRGRESQEDRGGVGPQVQIPGIGAPQKPHFPLLTSFVRTAYPDLAITTRRHAGQRVFSAS
jgi:hypothetical protein